ncbi:LANO_0B05710g1_1 [Lachancea nothofagi CBS 11611]|uniref:LANO_0B05710g1_1 n=1 Tax=Lachancea nothofagi CBS 11611 TaxID=1266666 RepID=A0A1G4IZ69_9SACH|nr:LANO_0B05710g1_1 [Lachancea nothofagi CBS 11611]
MNVHEVSKLLNEHENVAELTKGEFVCPVCEKDTSDLLQLNNHLDSAHGFAEAVSNGNKSIDALSKKQEKGAEVGTKAKFDLKRSHWAKSNYGQSRCNECNIKVSRSTGVLNCRRCGQIFCVRHCQSVMRLNKNAEYDAQNGEWCRCCRSCFNNRPGYNEFGILENRTEEFVKLRTSKNEDKQLQLLQLEDRFVRLINGILQINRNHQDSLLASVRKSTEIWRFEKSVVPWTPDHFVLTCCICLKSFGLTLRKHHCRLCGKIVCDDVNTNCSNQIPVLSLVNAASDLPIKLPASLDASEVSTQIRACSICTRSIFKKRKFEKEMSMPLPVIFQIYESMYSNASIILATISGLQAAAGGVQEGSQTNSLSVSDVAKLSKTRRQLLNTFSAYDRLTKHLVSSQPNNSSEARIQSAIISQASAFIQRNMLPLKHLTSALTSGSLSQESTPETSPMSTALCFNNLSIKEVKDYRNQLMVIKEQRFLVEDMIATATKQRKFDEATTLAKNLEELKMQADGLAELLGEEGFK